MDPIPTKLKQLRACLLCRLIKSYDQFRLHGCDNCESVLRMRGDAERVLECTSANYAGVVSVMDTAGWVARWMRLGEEAVRGMYAGRVWGELPADVADDLERRGVAPPEHLTHQ